MNTPLRDILERHENNLQLATRRMLMAAPTWAEDVPLEAGVYVVWEGDLPIYVGETSCLKARMSDIGRPVNHTFARKVCKALLLSPTSLEELAAAMRMRYTLSFATISYGRAEVEEYLVIRWQKTLVNKPAKRLLRSPQYDWVHAA